MLLVSLAQAVEDLTRRFGADPAAWAWGRAGYHYALIRHPLSAAVSDDMRSRLDVGPVPRGDGSTVGANSGHSGNQLAGASFRIVADVGDWDAAVGRPTPDNQAIPITRTIVICFRNGPTITTSPAYSRSRVEASAVSGRPFSYPLPDEGRDLPAGTRERQIGECRTVANP